MSFHEFLALLIGVPLCVFFSWKSGFEHGAITLLQTLHQSNGLTTKAVKEFGLDNIPVDIDNEE